MSDPSSQRDTNVWRVVTLARQLGRNDFPLGRRIEDSEVGRFTRFDRAAVAIGNSRDRGRLPGHGRDYVDKWHLEMRKRNTECRFETDHSGGRLIEWPLLGLRHVRGMVGGDCINRPVGEPVANRGQILGCTQRRVDLVERVVRGQ